MPPDAASPLQDSAAALGVIVIAGNNFYRWAPEVVSCSRAVEVVPLSVAETLVTAIELSLLTGSQIELREAIAEHRAAYPREETTG